MRDGHTEFYSSLCKCQTPQFTSSANQIDKGDMHGTPTYLLSVLRSRQLGGTAQVYSPSYSLLTNKQGENWCHTAVLPTMNPLSSFKPTLLLDYQCFCCHSDFSSTGEHCSCPVKRKKEKTKTNKFAHAVF